MHSRESAEPQTTTTTLAQSMGGIYLLVTVLLLFIIALLSLGGVAVRNHLAQMASSAPAASPIAKPVVKEPDLPDAAERAALYAKLGKVGEELSAETAERNKLSARLEKLVTLQAELAFHMGKGEEVLGDSGLADPHAALLHNMEEIERELSAVSQALEASERRISADQVEVSGLGVRLNRALLVKVEELQRGRSDFFSRLRDVLGSRSDFRIEGDRFTLPSEVLFAAGSDHLRPEGVEEVRRLAGMINGVKNEFPPGINWVLRVGGHTDIRPISSRRFPSNWELSALRAITVVKALVEAGVPPEHVSAAGFGEFHPISTEESDAGFARNRRIEFRLDQP